MSAIPSASVFATMASAAIMMFSPALAADAHAQARSPGERFLQRPPYYTGARVVASTGRLAHLPISYQRGGTHAALFDPKGGEGTAIAALLEEMNAFLDSLGVSAPLSLSGTLPGNQPDVHFGCELEASGDCVAREESDMGRRGRGLRLAVDRPSREWAGALARALVADSAQHALLITLEVGQYFTLQQGLRGDKMVDLGTAHRIRLPWLTSLETPVTVLQLTGALVDAEGRILRIGAEGLIVRRTPLLASSVGAQALLRDEDVASLRNSRREDLAGEPLTWQVALQHLVAQLTGRGDLSAR
jgi:hypothetical protein